MATAEAPATVTSPVPTSASGAALRVSIMRIAAVMQPIRATATVIGSSQPSSRRGTGLAFRSGEGRLTQKVVVSFAMVASALVIALASALMALVATEPAAAPAAPLAAAPTAGATSEPPGMPAMAAPPTMPAMHDAEVNGLQRDALAARSMGHRPGRGV